MDAALHRVPAIVTPPERQSSIHLQDGRRLAWSEWGPAEGRPVLFCTGAGMSGRLGFGAACLRVLGLRLLAVDRPGLGRSDAHPEKTLSSWADDLRALIQSADLRRPLAVGFSQGAPFALALVHRHLVEAAAIVSGQDQLYHPALQPLLHPDVAGMITSVQQDADAFERQFAQIATPDVLWKLTVDMSAEPDRSLYLEEPFSSAYRRALQEGFAQSAHGYARDLVNTWGTWPFEPEEIEAPVDLWYGARDASPGHSPDFGETMAARLRNASRTLDPEAGGSILWTRSRDILERLLSHAPGA